MICRMVELKVSKSTLENVLMTVILLVEPKVETWEVVSVSQKVCRMVVKRANRKAILKVHLTAPQKETLWE
jgi:hypothetical protein